MAEAQQHSIFKAAQESTNSKVVPDVSKIPCHDFSYMKQELNSMRKVDDNLIYRLNRTDVVREEDHVDCAQVWSYLWTMHQARNSLIERCTKETEMEYLEAKSELNANPSDKELSVEVMALKRQVSVLKSEIDIEKILHDESKEVFKDKCRDFRIPRGQR